MISFDADPLMGAFGSIGADATMRLGEGHGGVYG
jgi:hypothetical protein